MKRIKGIFIITWISGLLLGACSSDNDIIDTPEINNKVELDFSNAQWHKGSVSSQVEQGSNITVNTRSKDEIGNDENPAGKLPDNIQLYICYYDMEAGDLKREALPIKRVGGDFEYYYTFLNDGNDWYAVLSSDKEVSDAPSTIMKIKVRESKDIDSKNPEDLFLFTTFNAKENSTIKLPTTDEAKQPDLYPNADGTPNYVEYGDKLFATNGHFFAFDGEPTEENIKLYSIAPNSSNPKLIDSKAIFMQRITGVITIYTMVVDHFENSTSIPIPGMKREDDVSTMINATNQALQKALGEAGLDTELRVDDYFTRKKLLTNFPVEYSWTAGPDYTKRGNLYLCNRNDAAWMIEKGEFQKGNSTDFIYGVCSSCDNFPFIPAKLGKGTEIDTDCTLRLYMGIAKRGESAPKHLLTVDVEVTETMEILVNKSNNLFLLFTIEDMVELAQKAGRITKTRSISDTPDLILPSNRLILE